MPREKYLICHALLGISILRSALSNNSVARWGALAGEKRKKVLTTLSFIKCPAQGRYPLLFMTKDSPLGELLK